MSLTNHKSGRWRGASGCGAGGVAAEEAGEGGPAIPMAEAAPGGQGSARRFEQVNLSGGSHFGVTPPRFLPPLPTQPQTVPLETGRRGGPLAPENLKTNRSLLSELCEGERRTSLCRPKKVAAGKTRLVGGI